MLFMEEREFLHGGRISFLFWGGGWGGRELFSFPSSTEQMQMSCCCLTPPPVVPVLAVVVLRVQEQPAHTPTPRGASNWEHFTGCSCSWCRLHGSPPGYSTYSLPPPDRYTCLAQMRWQRETGPPPIQITAAHRCQEQLGANLPGMLAQLCKDATWTKLTAHRFVQTHSMTHPHVLSPRRF